MLINKIIEVLDTFRAVGLDDIGNSRLMNRVDTKYLISVKKVPELMTKMDGDYRVLDINNNRITLLGSEINERITIDRDLTYFDLDGNRMSFPFVAIIEHKRERIVNGSPIVKILKDNQIRN